MRYLRLSECNIVMYDECVIFTHLSEWLFVIVMCVRIPHDETNIFLHLSARPNYVDKINICYHGLPVGRHLHLTWPSSERNDYICKKYHLHICHHGLYVNVIFISVRMA